MTSAAAIVAGILAAPETVTRVRDYFHTRIFEGRWFELVGGAGDRPEVRDRITADDLVAVSMLSVAIPAQTMGELLLEELGEQASVLLADIPTDIHLAQPEAARYIARGSAAWQLWQLLDARPGMGTTKVSKLLARKRPHLLPVLDDVVLCALGRPPGPWEFVRQAVAPDGPAATELTRVRAKASTPPGVSDLRVLDVAIWGSHQAEHRAHRR